MHLGPSLDISPQNRTVISRMTNFNLAEEIISCGQLYIHSISIDDVIDRFYIYGTIYVRTSNMLSIDLSHTSVHMEIKCMPNLGTEAKPTFYVRIYSLLSN